jgi:hypothetical protein
MVRTLTVALAGLALAGATFAMTPARADSVSTTTVTTQSGPAFGYTDGYWDRGHAWHHWKDHGDMVHFEKSYHAHYYNGAHTGYPGSGWHEHDTWWSH